MDLALVAPDLALSAMAPVTAPVMEPNAEWILSWMEASPTAEAPLPVEAPFRMTVLPMASVASQIPEWPFEPEELAAQVEQECEAGDLVVETEMVAVDPLLPEETEGEPIGEDAEEKTAPVALVVSASTFSAMPPVSDSPAPKQPHVTDTGRQRLPAPRESAPTTPAVSDKGELIWEADLVVAAQQPDVASKAPSELELPPDETTRPAIEPAAPKLRADHEEPGRQDRGSEEQRPPADPAVTRKSAAAPSARAEAPEKTDPEPRAAKRVQATAKTEAPPPATPTLRAPVEAPVGTKIERVEGAVAVEAVAPAERLRPTQIARVQVDIGNPGQAPGADPAMRLVLTQRGENVSVQLRSWNDSVAPLPAADVQPLLENLAKQGLTPAAETAIESVAPIESNKERPFVVTQTAASQTDTRGSHGFNERQQRQQEQHRQQQEVFSRRQSKPGTDFDLQNALDEFQTR